MSKQERALYNRIAKLQGTLFKLIGNLESIKIALASEATGGMNQQRSAGPGSIPAGAGKGSVKEA